MPNAISKVTNIYMVNLIQQNRAKARRVGFVEKSYKGFINEGIEGALGILVVSILFGVGGITLSSFATGQTGTTLNIINNGSAGLLNGAIQMPTVGTLVGVGLMLMALFMAIRYVRQ
jgi:hypothetical protein